MKGFKEMSKGNKIFRIFNIKLGYIFFVFLRKCRSWLLIYDFLNNWNIFKKGVSLIFSVELYWFKQERYYSIYRHYNLLYIA